jgi:uncharacterized NAD(P)/FAD-binding protein YdhS
VLIVGSRLTAIDAALSVFARYPGAHVTFVSRYGYLPGLHDVASPAYKIAFPGPFASVKGVLRRLRTEVSAAEASGLPWQSVFDAMRSHWEPIWQGLPANERQRFIDHLLRHFDRFRHRVSAEAAEVLLPHFESGDLEVIAGTIRSSDGEGMVVVSEAGGSIRTIKANLALDCSGASMNWVRSSELLFCDLFKEEWLVEGPHGMGILADADGRVIGRDGRIGELFAIGPMLRGIRWETTAVHELRHQIDRVVNSILNAHAPLRHPA